MVDSGGPGGTFAVDGTVEDWANWEHHMGPEDRETFEGQFVPLSGNDLFQAQATPPAWLLTDLIRERSLVMVSGEPFSGKTLFLLSLAIALDTGHPFLDVFAPIDGHRCLFIGQDAPTWDYIGCYSALARGVVRGVVPHLPSIFILNKGLSLNQPQAFRIAVSEAVRLYGIDVLMLDVLKSFHDYDENSNVEMARVMDMLKALRDSLGLTVFMSHHTAKPNAQTAGENYFGNYRARGASVIAGSIDQHFLLRTGTKDKVGATIKLHMPKARGAMSGLKLDDLQLLEEQKAGVRALVLRSNVLVTDEMTRLVMGALDKEVSRRPAEVHRAIKSGFGHLDEGQTYNRMYQAMKRLEKQGLVEQPARGLWRRVRETVEVA